MDFSEIRLISTKEITENKRRYILGSQAVDIRFKNWSDIFVHANIQVSYKRKSSNIPIK